jgi:HlyD family secretion protein
VIAALLVDEGDDIVAGQLLAITDAAPVLEARVAASEAELVHAQRDAEAAHSKADETCVRASVASREARRLTSLLEQGLAAEEETEQAQGDAEARAAACTAMRVATKVAEAAIDVARARLITTQTQLQRTQIKAPISGRVLEVLAYPGELVSEEGVLELGNIDHMYAIAEVYETDVSRVHVGQRAAIKSDALPATLNGTVERIRDKVQKQDEIGTDPAARRDARIIEVEILLDDSAPAARFTYLQVDIVIGI